MEHFSTGTSMECKINKQNSPRVTIIKKKRWALPQGISCFINSVPFNHRAQERREEISELLNFRLKGAFRTNTLIVCLS
jgi:hypothetical protein